MAHGSSLGQRQTAAIGNQPTFIQSYLLQEENHYYQKYYLEKKKYIRIIMKKYKPENTIANVNGQHVRIVNNSVKQIAKYVVGLSDDKLEEDINVSTVKNNCYICKDIIVEIRAEQVLKPGDIISYPLNENTNLNVRVPDIIISGNSNNVLYF